MVGSYDQDCAASVFCLQERCLLRWVFSQKDITMNQNATSKFCPECHHSNAIGRVTCEYCGYALTGESATVTLTHREKQTQPLVNTISIFVLGYDRPVELNGMQDVILGRGTPDWQPTLDLTPFDAQYMGISRSHARISYNDSAYIITDLSSTNGTWLNEKRLQPEVPYALHNGDTLRLGRLIMVVYFKDVAPMIYPDADGDSLSSSV